MDVGESIMNKGMIKMLQRNMIPYGLLDKGMQEAMNEVGKKNFLFYNAEGRWDDDVSKRFYDTSTYRLKSDYKEHLLFEEVAIAFTDKGELLCRRWWG